MNKLILFFCFIINGFELYGQTTIRGFVQTNEKQSLVGANVFLKNTFEGCTTDSVGKFEFETNLQDTQTLVISFMGYKTFEQRLILNKGILEIQVLLAEDNTQLNEVTITAGQFEAGEEKKSVVLGRMDVCTSSGGAFDIYSAFNALPGTSISGDEGGLMVRGGEQYETKTFIDGLLVESPFTAKMPNVPVRGRFTPMLFKGIIFNTGGYSAEYGQALSSALILNSIAMPQKSETGIAFYSCAMQISTTKKWNNNAITSITDYSNLKPYYSLVKSNIKWDKEPENLSQTLVYRQKIKSSGMLKILSSYMYENSGLYYQNVNTDAEDLISLETQNFFLIASYTGQLSENWLLNSGASFNIDNFKTGINLDKMDDKSLANEFRLTLSNQLSEKVKIKFGGNIFNKTNKLEFYQQQTDTAYSWSFKSNINAAFTETAINLGKRTALRLGLRYEYLSLNQKDYISPRISFAYQLFNNCQVSFVYGKFTQQAEDAYLLYNKKLDPERAEHFIANIQINKNARIFRIEAYYKNYEDLIKYDSLYAINAEAYNNLGSGYARGIDIFLKDNKTIKNGEFWISYSLMDTRRDYQDFECSLTPTFVSKHNFSMQYKHYFGKLDMYAGFMYTFASGRPYIDPNISLEQQQFTKPYSNLSLNVFHFTKLLGKFLMLHLQVSNVLGTDQIFGYRYSTHPKSDGNYQAWPIKSANKRFIIVGVYMNLNGQPEL
jgi:outer membrane cobalamin receptor